MPAPPQKKKGTTLGSVASTGWVEIVRTGWVKQKWHAKFIADNGKTLAHTENYHNLQDVKDMLKVYYPQWKVNVVDE